MKKIRTFIDEEGNLAETLADPGEILCDFCSASGPSAKIYDAEDVEVVEGHMSKGAWAACAHCAVMIDADDREGLIERAFIMFAGRIPGGLDDQARDDIRLIIDTFFKHRK